MQVLGWLRHLSAKEVLEGLVRPALFFGESEANKKLAVMVLWIVKHQRGELYRVIIELQDSGRHLRH